MLAALPGLSRGWPAAVIEKFHKSIDCTTDPFDQVDLIAAAGYAETFLESDPLVRAGEAVLAGQTPPSAHELQDELFEQRQRCMVELRRIRRDRQGETLSQLGRTRGGHSAACSSEGGIMTIKNTTERLALEAFPLLNRLALSEEELSALARQGSIRRERRGRKTIFRLRYRVHGRQCVRYVSPRDAAALEAELTSLQRRVRARRRLTGLAALARQLLRQRKSTLAPLLEAHGYHYHGHQIRRFRNAK